MIEIIYFSILFFIVGTVFASFCGVIIYRVPKNLSIIKPKSHCPICQKEIKWYDNIPIISYVILKGKCRYCNNKIGISSLFLEIIGGVSFSLSYLNFKLSFELIFIYLFILLFLIISFIDFFSKSIYDWSLWALFVISIAYVLYLWLIGKNIIYIYLLGGLVGFCFFYLLRFIGNYILKQESLGMGDVFLFGICGLILGWDKLLLCVLIASILGILIGILFRIIKKDNEIPFAPFICFGTFICLLYGNFIIRFFLEGINNAII